MSAHGRPASLRWRHAGRPHRKDRGIHANADGNDKERDRCEPGCSGQRTHGEAQVSPSLFEPGERPIAPHALSRRARISKAQIKPGGALPEDIDRARHSGPVHEPAATRFPRPDPRLVNFLSRYRLHVWRCSLRMYFGMCLVLQGHNEFKTVTDCDVQRRTFEACLGDRLWRAVFGRISLA